MIDFILDSVYYEHSRKILGILDVLGDFGGIEGVLVLIIAMFMGPVASHSFFISAI